MVRESIPKVSNTAEIHGYLDKIESGLDCELEAALDDVERGRNFIRDSSKGYEVIDTYNNVKHMFPGLESSGCYNCLATFGELRKIRWFRER